MKKFLEGVKRFLEHFSLLPKFGEDTVFLMAISVALVLVIDDSARAFALQVKDTSPKVALICLVGMGIVSKTP